MATKTAATDPWRNLIRRQEPDKILSRKWKNRKPDVADFGLEGVSLNGLYKEKFKFEDERDERVAGLTADLPAAQKKIGWSGWMTVAFLVALTAYMLMNPYPSWYIMGALSAGTIAFFLVYVGKKLTETKRMKEKAEDLQLRKKRIREAEFEEQDSYDHLLLYAEAVYDYETWQKRRTGQYWKELDRLTLEAALRSLFTMSGCEADLSEYDYIDVLIKDQDGYAIACNAVTGRRLNRHDVTNMAESMKKEGLHSGIIINFAGSEQSADQLAASAHIEVWGQDEILELAEYVDENDKPEFTFGEWRMIADCGEAPLDGGGQTCIRFIEAELAARGAELADWDIRRVDEGTYLVLYGYGEEDARKYYCIEYDHFSGTAKKVTGNKELLEHYKEAGLL